MASDAPKSSKKLLVVEDDQALRHLYVQALQRAGYQVDQAADGQEGLTALQAGGYDLVLLDLVMPKLDGLAILRQLKTTPPAKPNQIIIILTNLDQNETIGQGIELGAKGYLIKVDYTPEKIVKEVNNFLFPTV